LRATRCCVRIDSPHDPRRGASPGSHSTPLSVEPASASRHYSARIHLRQTRRAFERSADGRPLNPLDGRGNPANKMLDMSLSFHDCSP